MAPLEGPEKLTVLVQVASHVVDNGGPSTAAVPLGITGASLVVPHGLAAPHELLVQDVASAIHTKERFGTAFWTKSGRPAA